MHDPPNPFAQIIEDSAHDFRVILSGRWRRRIAAGESPEAVRRWLIARYGNWVTYDPPFDTVTALLWIGPLLFLLAGLWLARSRFVLRGGSDGDAA